MTTRALKFTLIIGVSLIGMVNQTFAEVTDSLLEKAVWGCVHGTSGTATFTTSTGSATYTLSADGCTPNDSTASIPGNCPKPKKDAVTDEQVQCICRRLREYNSVNKISAGSQMAEYCVAFENTNASTPVEGTLLALDAAAAATCWTACIAKSPRAEKACNCFGFIEGGIDFGWQTYLMAETSKLETPDALKILTGPVVGSLGFAMGVSDVGACFGK